MTKPSPESPAKEQPGEQFAAPQMDGLARRWIGHPDRSAVAADRLEAMLHQVGHPDYSLKEFYEGIKLIVWELRQPPPPERP